MEQAHRFELLMGRKGTTALPWNGKSWWAVELPSVPVLAETLLKMEFELSEGTAELRSFAEIVLRDIGATIEVLRLAGKEYGAATDRPVRVEDCISDLGPRACLLAMTRNSLQDGCRQASAEVWAHSREVAQYFKLLAAQAPGRVSPDQAYVAGLLHALGALPSVLGWDRHGIAGAPARIAVELTERWHLPQFLKDFFSEILMPGHSTEWSNFITVAHHPAKESWLDCPLVAARRYAYS